ncbi:MAG: hypothetical protein HGA76_02750 [Candidatus Firestonebacteria bacterium]|nr:hypothetical protein [Candidatus Firestonebacteria bacterium]
MTQTAKRKQVFRPRLILASVSPRRQQLLRQAGLTHKIVPPRYAEGRPHGPLLDGPVAHGGDLGRQHVEAVERQDAGHEGEQPDAVLGVVLVITIIFYALLTWDRRLRRLFAGLGDDLGVEVHHPSIGGVYAARNVRRAQDRRLH